MVRARRAAGPLPGLLLRSVRNVAPGKLMMCASFRLPRAVAEARVASVTCPLAHELAAAAATGGSVLADAGAGAGAAGADADADAEPAAKRPRATEA